MVKTREDLSYCGVDCQECNIYRAMMFGEELKPETLNRWREDAKKYWNMDAVKPEDLNCKGCRTEHEDGFFVLKLCPVRKCCRERELSSCGLCQDFDTCSWGPPGRENLEKIAAGEK